MDATTSGATTPSLHYHAVAEQPLPLVPPLPPFSRQIRHCCGESTPGEFPLASKPSIVLYVLTACNLDPEDLASLEATCLFFRRPANFQPESELSISELSALDMCRKRVIFKSMKVDEREALRVQCGGSWKLVLRYLLAGEAYGRREMSQAIAGPGHSLAVNSRGDVYSFGSNSSGQLGHGTMEDTWKPQIIRSVYSLGCGLGGKLGHGLRTDEKYPRAIEKFKALDLQPAVVAAGAWHAAVVGKDGRVCTWGWGRYGCLGHGNEESETVPKVVEALGDVKAVHVATGDYTTFVLSNSGDVYSFGCGESSSLGHPIAADAEGNRQTSILTPRLVTSLKDMNEHIVQISLTNSVYWNAHTFALTESGKLYAFGSGDKGQLGVELKPNEGERPEPEMVGNVDLC